MIKEASHEEDSGITPVFVISLPDGEVQYFRGGQSIGYSIYSISLPLDELIKIAESMLAE